MIKYIGLVVVLLTAALFTGCSTSDGETPFSMAIMTTAELQSHVTSYEVVSETETITVGGLDRIASVVAQVRSGVDGSLLLSSGNDLLGAFYRMFQGAPEMQAMTLAGYDIVTPGNHAFDYGVELYRHALSFAGFDLVSANLIVDDPDVAERVLPYVIRDVAGVRVGVFGLMTPDFFLLCNPPGGGVDVEPDIIPIAQHMVSELQQKGCQLIIGLTHVGLARASEMAHQLSGIHIIVDGYEGESRNYYKTVDDTIIVQGDANGEYIGILRFSFTDGLIMSPSWERILTDDQVGSDPEILALTETFMQEYEERLGEQIGVSNVDLDARADVLRKGEANMGDLVADTWMNRFPETDMALVNSGSIRGDTIYPAGALSYLSVNEILPFRDNIVIVEMTGADIRQSLEISASAIRVAEDGCQDGNRAPTGGFLQVGGLRISMDIKQPPFCAVYSGKEATEIIQYGSRITDVQVYQQGVWVQLEQGSTYTVLVNGYIADGGDGHYLFRQEGLAKIVTTTVTTDVLADYIVLHTPISPEVDGRIAHAH